MAHSVSFCSLLPVGSLIPPSIQKVIVDFSQSPFHKPVSVAFDVGGILYAKTRKEYLVVLGENMPLEPTSIVWQTRHKYTETERSDEPAPLTTGSGLNLSHRNRVRSNPVAEQKNVSPDKGRAFEKIRSLQGKEADYVLDKGFVFHDHDQEAKEKALLYHSEKLAIAYGLINTPPP